LAFHARVQTYLDFLDVSVNSYTPTSLRELAQTSGLEIELWSYFDTRRGTCSQTQRRRGEMIYAALRHCSGW
jgi:hypothetical protein